MKCRVLHARAIVDLSKEQAKIQGERYRAAGRTHLEAILTHGCHDLACVELERRDRVIILERLEDSPCSDIPYL